MHAARRLRIKAALTSVCNHTRLPPFRSVNVGPSANDRPDLQAITAADAAEAQRTSNTGAPSDNHKSSIEYEHTHKLGGRWALAVRHDRHITMVKGVRVRRISEKPEQHNRRKKQPRGTSGRTIHRPMERKCGAECLRIKYDSEPPQAGIVTPSTPPASFVCGAIYVQYIYRRAYIRVSCIYNSPPPISSHTFRSPHRETHPYIFRHINHVARRLEYTHTKKRNGNK